MDLFGFIILRHVNSEKTNNYWNHSIKQIRRFYPFAKIIIIDDAGSAEEKVIDIIIIIIIIDYCTEGREETNR